MRIGLDARYVYDHFPGIGRYVYALAAALGELEHGHTLVLITNPGLPTTRFDLAALGRFANIELVNTTARPFSAGEQIAIPRLARALRLNLFHAPYYLKPFLPLPCPAVVTIYDLIGRRFPKLLTARSRLLFDLATKLAIRTSRRVITISRSAADDLVYYYGVPRANIAITPLAADRAFRPQPADALQAVRERYGLPRRYVLFVGANKPHKNLERLIRAWERVGQAGDVVADVRLVIAGHYDPRYPEARQLVQEKGMGERVQFVPNVAEADLPSLYAGAEVFCFPSYYEGFGLPPLEAMACGTPVVCAYASSLPEVVGNAAITVDPHSSIEMAAELLRVLSNEGLRRRLSTQGLARSREFSWRRTALATLAVYEDVGRG